MTEPTNETWRKTAPVLTALAARVGLHSRQVLVYNKELEEDKDWIGLEQAIDEMDALISEERKRAQEEIIQEILCWEKDDPISYEYFKEYAQSLGLSIKE